MTTKTLHSATLHGWPKLEPATLVHGAKGEMHERGRNLNPAPLRTCLEQCKRTAETSRGHMLAQARQEIIRRLRGGQLGGDGEAVVHAGVSQVVQEVLQGALAGEDGLR
jgi:hypothetical protein